MLTVKEKAKDSRLRNQYPPLTLEIYRVVLRQQGGKCPICKRPINFLNKKGKRTNDFAVDHCHTTGLFRGLLCMECNRAIAKFRDDAVRLENAAKYLSYPPAVIAFNKAIYTVPGRIGTKVRAKALTKFKQRG